MSGNYTSGLGSGLKATFIVIIMIVGSAAAIATIAGFFGTMWWGFDLVANYRWHLMWISLFVSIVYSLSARGFLTAVFLAAVAINGWLVAPLWLSSQPSATGEGGVRIVQIDLHGGDADQTAVLRWLFDTGADLIVASGTTSDRMLPLVADGSPYTMLVSPGEDRTGMVIVGQDAWTVSTVDTGDDQPVYRVSVPSGDDTLEVITGWGSLATSSMKATRLSARLAAVKEAADATTNPVVVVGNLGATRWSEGLRNLQATNDLRDATEGSGYLATSPVSSLPIIGGWLGLPIDLVLMEPALTPLDIFTGPDLGADHLPVTVVVGPSFTG